MLWSRSASGGAMMRSRNCNCSSTWIVDNPPACRSSLLLLLLLLESIPSHVLDFSYSTADVEQSVWCCSRPSQRWICHYWIHLLLPTERRAGGNAFFVLWRGHEVELETIKLDTRDRNVETAQNTPLLSPFSRSTLPVYSWIDEHAASM